MAVKRDSRYPGRWTPADADFPLGGPKNRTTDTSKDGSYFNRDFIADYEAFFQRLMSEGGVTVNETPDTAPTSQFFEALSNLIVPVGFTLYSTLSAQPVGRWIKGNGSALSRTAYADLFADAVASSNYVSQALKDADQETYAGYYGDGDGSTTFTLPDLRAEFIRTWDDGRGVDGGRGFGSFQDGTWIRTVAQEWSGSDVTGSEYIVGTAYAKEDAGISSSGVGGVVPNGAKSASGATYNLASTDNVIKGTAGIDTSSSVNNWIKMRPRNVAYTAWIRY